MVRRSRKPAIVTGLLYPGFLGALVYEAVPKLIYGEPKRFALETVVLILALLWHYVLDYIYTYDRDPDAPYDWLMFIADALIVVFLFLAIRQSYDDTALHLADARIWLFMLGTKLAAFVWELADARYSGFDRDKERALLGDWVFAWPYMLGMFFCPDQPLMLAGVLIADAGAYLWHEHLNKKSAAFHDHFSAVAGHYAGSRPTYPAALFSWLADQCAAHDLVWDCGAGSGQASVELACHFKQVKASDASPEQIAQALPHPRVGYFVAPAENSGLPNHCADLIVVAQALHWFDLDRFYAEARRVLKPGGVIAVWTYGVQHVEGEEVDALVQHFYSEEVGAYWPPERHYVESGYQTLAFPFQPVVAPPFTMSARWSLQQLLGYFRSWSATARFIKANGVDPVAALEPRLREVWGEPQQLRTVEWPLVVRVGRVE